MEILTSPEAWMSLLTLTMMEIVLGIDNVIFISILAGKLPASERDKARNTGLILALVTRLLLLSAAAWIASLTQPLFSVFGQEFSGKSLILLGGGLFLMFKATKEVHEKLEGEEHVPSAGTNSSAKFAAVIVQILLLDVVFSIDSVITAVGMSNSLIIMVIANVLALVVMLISSKGISNFVERHPTVKMLALSFLLLIGMMLTIDAFNVHVPKGYIYFAMGFSVSVEVLNIKMRGRGKPVALHNTPKE